jgi:hypothetical protein
MLVRDGKHPQPEEQTAVNDTPASISGIVDGIEKTFGGRWGVWCSDTGSWWASRRHTLSAAQLTAGCVPFLRAADPHRLANCIAAQDDLEVQAGLAHTTAHPSHDERRRQSRNARTSHQQRAKGTHTTHLT